MAEVVFDEVTKVYGDGTKAVDPALPAIDLVLHEPRPWTPGPTLSNSFGFGGHNGCLVIGPA